MKFATILFSCLLVAGLSFETSAQQSPPAKAKGMVGGAEVEVNYHQPSARGREIMGGLVPYGEVWRTGANAATTISFDRDVEIEGEDLSAGTYSLYTIPGEKEWTIIFNNATGQWGTQYPQESDALRVVVPAHKTDEFVETFTISSDENHVNLSWEHTKVSFKVKG
ncbi:MAG: DUF2911 domain-containing protein [Cyclobacteriaceae bacterium]